MIKYKECFDLRVYYSIYARDVKDGDTIADAIDVGFHLGVPAFGLVSEMNACVHQVENGRGCHLCFSFFLLPYFSILPIISQQKSKYRLGCMLRVRRGSAPLKNI